MPANSPGRNDPCPCGSGRKFKHCCLQRDSADTSARMRIRSAEGRVVDGAMSYAAERWGAPFFHAAWREFFVWEDVPEDMTGTQEFEPMFIPWLTTLYVPEPHREQPAGSVAAGLVDDEDEDDGPISDPDWPEVPLARFWADEEHPKFDDLDRRWIDVATRSPMSAFVAEAVEPGRSVDIRDILTGKRFHVLEQSASKTLERHGVLFTRVITIDGVSLMFGLAPWVIGPDWHNWVIDWRERAQRGRRMTRADLEEWDIEIRELYLDIVARMLDPDPPQLRNTDGDPIALTTLTFDLTCPVDDAARRLAPLATLPGETDDDVFDEVDRGEDGRISSATLSWAKAGNKQHKSWSNTVLGTLRLSSGRLVAEVNSEKRAQRLIREVTKALRADAVLVSREAIDPAQALAERMLEPGLSQEPVEPPRPPELDAMEEELFRRHLEEWVDTKVPALGNKTPRAAARTPLGRERLSALIASFESGQADRLPNGRKMLSDLRRTLGLDVDV